MSRITLISSLSGALVLAIVLLTASAPPGRARTLRNEQTARMNLADLATVQLPQKFQPVGNGSNRTPNAKGFDAKSVEFHRNEQLVTFRFEAEQRNNMGGYPEDPILLNVSLWNPAAAPGEILQIGGTTIARFYPPVDDVARKSSHFRAQQWMPDIKQGASISRSAATNQGRGDNLVSAPPARWLVIHVDPVKKVRVDMYVWQKLYSLDEARALAQTVAASVETTPKLAPMFASVKTVDARLSAQHQQAVTTAITHLKPCGIAAIDPGQTAFNGECSAWLSNDQRYLHVARSIGRVPHPGAKRPRSEVPEFRVAAMPPGKPAALMGPPDFQTFTFYWDARVNKWSIDELGSTMYDDDPKTSPLVLAIADRLSDHAQVYVVCMARYDLQFHANRVAIDAFLSEANRTAAALRAGTLITGVRATADAFGK